MKIIIVLSMLLSIGSGWLLILIIKSRNGKFIKKAEKTLKSTSNSFSFISLFITIISLIITALGILYTIKEPKIDITFNTGHNIPWESENGDKQVYLIHDDEQKINYAQYQPTIWHISLSNLGNKTIDKLTIKITFSGLQFIDQHYDYNMTDHLHGLGGYATLERTFNDVDPGSSVDLPCFPFENALTFKKYTETETDSIKMIVSMFINDKESEIKEYNIDIKGLEERDKWIFKGYTNDDRKIVKGIVSEFNELQNNEVHELMELEFANVYSLNIDNEKIDDYKFVYDYYISNLDCYNEVLKEEVKSNALFWGRVYYLCESNILDSQGKEKYSITDIENMIRNDLDFKNVDSLYITSPIYRRTNDTED